MNASQSGKVSIALAAAGLVFMVLLIARALAPGDAPPGDAPPVRSAGGLTEAQVRAAGLSLREAMYYDKLPDKAVKCRLCPSLCTLARGERGACRARANIDGVLRTLVYGRLVAASNDPIEKKPLNHFKPGSRAFSIATAGCNLGCVFCQNWRISQAHPDKARFVRATPEQVVAKAKELNCGVIAYTYTEPTVFYEFMLDCARLARKEGLKNVWVTCGNINPEPLKELCKVMDAANIDLKGYSEAFYREYCHGRLKPVLATLVQAKKAGLWVEVTNLVIPGANDKPEMIRAMCQWHVKNLGADTPLHFSRFFPNYRLLDRPPTPPASLKRAAALAKEAGIHHVYVGNMATDVGRDTLCPKCGHAVLARQGYFVRRNDLQKGKCPKCGTAIAGVW